MSDKIDSIDPLELESRITKVTPFSGKQALKHTNCQSIPSTLMSYGHSQATASSNSSQPDGKHHHHHHHHHGHNHHQPHVIHRTTSESLRLGSENPRVNSEINNTESSLSLSNSTSISSSSGGSATGTGTSSSGGGNQPLLSASMPRKPKTSSFQITSVTVGNKLSADNGEDSADDLDESHTDDNSRITDMENETPSFSEDTFSKEDVFFSNSALGTAPVIPTSSQYGLVIVDSDLGGVGGQPGQNLSNVHVSMTDAGINIVGPPSGKGDSDQKDMHHRNERFKVVKIESTEPFKRGRWMCMDYLDHSTLQGSDSAASTTSNTAPSTAQAGVTNDSGVVIVENNTDVGSESAESNAMYNTGMSNIMSNATHSPGQTLQKPLAEQQSQPLGSNISNVPSGMIPQSTASMPNTVPASASQANMVCQNYSQPQMHQSLPPQQYQQTPHMPGQSQPAHFYQNNQQSQSTAPNIHGATLPSNMSIQNGVPANFVPQVQQQSQAPTQPISTVNVGMSAPASCADQNQAANIVTSMPPATMGQPTSISQPTSMAQVITQSQQPEVYIPQPAAQSYAGSGIPVTSSASAIPMDIHHADMNSVQQQQQQPPAVGGLAVAANTTPQTISPAVETMMQQQQQQQQPQTNQSPLQNIAAISQESVPPMTIINEASSTVSTPQQAQASSTASVPGQQQSNVNSEEDQAAALEADSER